MTLRIKKLTIKNFKVFPNLVLDFNSNNLSLLDGPNGFGKTSFYDALELLFLGNISRYTDLDDKVSNRRKALGGYPLVFDDALPDDELSIEIEMDCQSGPITLKRCEKKSKLDSFKRMSDVKMNLFISTGDNFKKVSDEESFLCDLLGDNYKKNYGLFHYIEQEENTTLLKGKAESKQQKIDHLFDISDYRSKIEKLKLVQKTIAPLKAPAKKKELATLKQDLVQLKSRLIPSIPTEIEYKRLINTTNQSWDKQDLQFEPGIFAEWLSENGTLRKLRVLTENSIHIINKRYNENIDKKLSLVDKVIEPLLRYGAHVNNLDSYKLDVKLYDQSIEFLDFAKEGIIYLYEKNRAVPTSLILSNMSEDFSVEAYRDELRSLKNSIESSSKLETSLNKLLKSKSNYLEDFQSYQENIEHKDTKCPTCGHNWLDHTKLMEEIENQETILTDILDVNNSLLKEKVKNIEDKYLDVIIKHCKVISNYKKSTIEFKRSLTSLKENQVQYLIECIKEYEKFGISLNEYFLSSMDLSIPVPKGKLTNAVKALYKPVDHTFLTDDIIDLFTSIFNNNESELSALTISEIDKKHQYIKLQYEKSKLKDIEAKEGKYKVELDRFNNAQKIWNELKDLIDIYNKNINKYIESISRGIEIFFHIYSGRLLQNYQNGVGIFIDTDGKSISFKENPNKEHDVIFTMSSGQLSSLVISFSMALNNKYAKNPILLIDDPVQTMDEINVAGFIDLLRHEFKDRQIFISTHEDHTSSYFRYKFRKANLDTQRINFKDEAFKLSNRSINSETD
ncbi:AAA family ATPase [Vibrio crassostreae]|uniref:AAA family ATPase n=1 Tax=Vibrio crassostreae TaxID=246167 RepID=UPI001050B46B|nr:AAA family ATPase [Vibrio crassostreae]TCW22319.1 AAA domain-containing protein [Vibrio crassostreae]CAK3446923.1 Rad50/SbcC-type AAA domain-containing protein [Vibrio crassostreae]